jgi:hypothetical protein
MTSKTEATTTKIGKLDFLKMFCTSKNTIKKVKKTAYRL